MIKNLLVERGEIYMIKLAEQEGSIQSGYRPCVVISNEKCNQYSPVITVVPFSSQLDKAKLPTHVSLGEECGLRKTSIALCEQILTVSKSDIDYKVGKCTNLKMEQIEKAIKIQTQLLPSFDESIINKIVSEIQKLKELFSQYRDEFIYQLFQRSIDELKSYCSNYNRDYTRYCGRSLMTA